MKKYCFFLNIVAFLHVVNVENKLCIKLLENNGLSA